MKETTERFGDNIKRALRGGGRGLKVALSRPVEGQMVDFENETFRW